MLLEGGCFCRRTRYEGRGTPFHATICHCEDCRRVAAAPFMAWFSLRSSELRWTAGEPRYFTSSPGVTRGFCPHCGTPLIYRNSGTPDEIDITTCSLDDPALVPPQDHVRTHARLAWVRMADGFPQYPHGRNDSPPIT